MVRVLKDSCAYARKQAEAWLPYNEALKRLTYKTSKDVLKKGMKTLTKLEH